MKTKTLFLTLFAGAFLCFSTASYAQYHHSGGSSGGSGDGAFDEGQNDFNLGVGFGGGLAGALNLVDGTVSGGGGVSSTSSVSPCIRLDWEHGKSEHIGYGILFGYQSASFANSYTETVFTGYDQNGFPVYSNSSFTDTWKVTLITFAARGAYHFTAGKSFDPYIGITIGYAIASFTYSSTNPDAGSIAVSGTGIALGAQGGARYYFSDHIGAFVEVGYATNYAMCFGNVGIAFKF